jgi:hypothetical protein
MAAYSTGSVANGDAFYQVIRAAMIANGWTEHDIITDVATTRDIVFRSSPIDAIADNRAFIRLTQDGTTATAGNGVYSYQDWDPVAHVGIQQNVNPGFTGVLGGPSSFTYFMRVTPHAVAICSKISTTYTNQCWGFLRRGLEPKSGGVTKTTQAYAAGTTVMNVASDMRTKLRNGQKVLIKNYAHNNASANKTNAQIRTIAKITTSTITFTAGTSVNFDSGALIGWNPLPSMTTSGASGSVGHYPGLNTWFSIYLDGTALVLDNNPQFLPLGEDQYGDPGTILQEHSPGVFSALNNQGDGEEGFRGYFYNYIWIPGVGGSPSNPAKETIFDCGPDTYIVLGNANPSGTVLLMGPR